VQSAAREWAWVIPPAADLVGYLDIRGTIYRVSEQQFEYDSGLAGRLWDVRKPDGTTYRVTLDADGALACDCPDATYRERECKHCRHVRDAYAELARVAALDAFLTPAPIDAPF
jgi:YD repeat-containing protein